jgi:hypothetical protein
LILHLGLVPHRLHRHYFLVPMVPKMRERCNLGEKNYFQVVDIAYCMLAFVADSFDNYYSFVRLV